MPTDFEASRKFAQQADGSSALGELRRLEMLPISPGLCRVRAALVGEVPRRNDFLVGAESGAF